LRWRYRDQIRVIDVFWRTGDQAHQSQVRGDHRYLQQVRAGSSGPSQSGELDDRTVHCLVRQIRHHEQLVVRNLQCQRSSNRNAHAGAGAGIAQNRTERLDSVDRPLDCGEPDGA